MTCTVFSDETTDLLRSALDAWGTEPQLRQLQEECGELIAAINHFCRGREGSAEELAEEVADVLLVAMQIRELAPALVDLFLNSKLLRVRSKIERLHTTDSEAK